VKKLLVDGFTTKIAYPTGSFRVLVCPSGVDVSTSTLRYLSAARRPGCPGRRVRVGQRVSASG